MRVFLFAQPCITFYGQGIDAVLAAGDAQVAVDCAADAPGFQAHAFDACVAAALQVDALSAQVAGVPDEVVALVEIDLGTAVQPKGVGAALGCVEAGAGGDVQVVAPLDVG
ncbi:hypothetical protein D3C73_1342470 [compost metagenome]